MNIGAWRARPMNVLPYRKVVALGRPVVPEV
jgi:hypothetical protein